MRSLKPCEAKRSSSFLSLFTIDNSETEYELDIEYRTLWQKKIGITEYRVAKAPNDDDNFVDCLVDLYKKNGRKIKLKERRGSWSVDYLTQSKK